MLDPGLVMTGTKCGYNHVSPFFQLHSGAGLQRTAFERHGLWKEGGQAGICASVASFTKRVSKARTTPMEGIVTRTI